MNVKHLIVTLCLVVGYALAIHDFDEGNNGRSTLAKSGVKESLKEKKEKRNAKAKSCPVYHYKVYDPEEGDYCYTAPPYIEEKYRTFDGSWNNKYHPTWGMKDTQFLQFTKAYIDGYHKPRKANKPASDPGNFRNLREIYIPTNDDYDKIWTVLLMTFGQYLAHDTVKAKLYEDKCCPMETENEDHCYSIDLNPVDEIYADNEGCVAVPRQLSECRVKNGTLKYNEVNSWLDNTLLYGKTKKEAEELRNPDGSMKVENYKDKYGRIGQFFKNSENVKKDCSGNYPNETICFKAGDDRVCQNPWLAVLQNIFLREHNRIHAILKKLNPHWDGDRLYQETRKIVIAELQNIAVYQWLPYIVGEKKIAEYGLKRPPPGKYKKYCSDFHPNTMAEFSIVAFRDLHKFIPYIICLKKSPHDKDCYKKEYLKDWFNRCGPFIPEYFDELVLATVAAPMKQPTPTHSVAISDYLFKPNWPYKKYGKGLGDIDWVRNIETGVGPYVDFLRLTGRSGYASFEDYGPSRAELLQQYYNDPREVDPITGTSLEEPVKGGLVGPTIADIITVQFAAWVYGDSWWYDGELNRNNWTKEQLIELQKKPSMARIMCENSNGITEIQPDVFKLLGPGNEVVPCSSLPTPDLSYWKEKPSVPAPSSKI